jgi:hypothetical protein
VQPVRNGRVRGQDALVFGRVGGVRHRDNSSA